ncbi:hypothetical protein GEMRC1_008551 [Eukaryota sp. GEM-RC1]
MMHTSQISSYMDLAHHLSNQHKCVALVLSSFQKLLSSSVESFDIDTARDFVTFFSQYACGFHDAFEEEFIYNHALQLKDVLDCVLVIKNEHTKLRNLCKEMEQALSGPLSSFKKIATQYFSCQLFHAYVEDTQLFPKLAIFIGEFELEQSHSDFESQVRDSVHLEDLGYSLIAKFLPDNVEHHFSWDAFTNSCTASFDPVFAHLKNDHQLILNVISFFEKKFEADTCPESRKVHSAVFISFLSRYFLDVHSKKESDVLFPIAKQLGFPSDFGPLPVLIGDLEYIRDLIADCQDSDRLFDDGDDDFDCIFDLISDVRILLKSKSGVLYRLMNFHLAEHGFTDSQKVLAEFELLEDNCRSLFDELDDVFVFSQDQSNLIKDEIVL